MTTVTISPDQTVGEIAAQFPASVRVLERYRIDFCCGGRVPFGEACHKAGADPAAVRDEIANAGVAGEDSTDWQSASLNSLIDHIVNTHHVYLKAELPRLEAMLVKILAKHGEAHGGVLVPLAQTFRPMKEELLSHLMKEEMILFPLMRSLAAGEEGTFHCGSIQNPIRVMLMEHDSAGDALGRLRALTSGFTAPDDACNTFRAFYYELAELESDLHRHIHLENNILFPRAVELVR
ncbi:MAG TPA: iron-sulfur cluster repair di-iron protein [Bryobacteraceae bacterium]|nr:iron-sulfur cluster repair di-iron protein [Bryobacteraceae bacterium]